MIMHKKTSFTTSKHRQQLVLTSIKPLISSSSVLLSLERNLPQRKGNYATIGDQAKKRTLERESAKEHYDSHTVNLAGFQTSKKLETEVKRG